MPSHSAACASRTVFKLLQSPIAGAAVLRSGVPGASLLGLSFLAGLSHAVAEDIDAAKARQQFVTSCGVCHTAEKGGANRQGPNLHDIVGKPARADFRFSTPLKSSGLTWDEATLDRWIEDAQAMSPGTIMAYRQRDPGRRKLIIAYLKTLAEPT